MRYLVREAKDYFNGVIHYFTVNNIGVFKYFSASGRIFSKFGSPNILLNYSNEGTSPSDQWASTKESPFVTFTLKCPMLLTNYRLKTRTDQDSHYPVSWKVEGLSTDNLWDTIDTKSDREELKGQGKAYTFKCDKQMIVKQIRITGTKFTWEWYLILSKVEFFGSMNLNQCEIPFPVSKFIRNTCNNKRSSLNIHLFILMLVS